MDEPVRRLVGMSWMVARTGLARQTIQEHAQAGDIPSATKLLNVWRFDPDEIEAWIAAGQPTQRTTESRGSLEPAPTAPAARGHQGRRAPIPAPESTPPLVVLFPNAAHRGINDVPSETARPTASRGTRTRKTAAPR